MIKNCTPITAQRIRKKIILDLLNKNTRINTHQIEFVQALTDIALAINQDFPYEETDTDEQLSNIFSICIKRSGYRHLAEDLKLPFNNNMAIRLTFRDIHKADDQKELQQLIKLLITDYEPYSIH